MKFCVCVWVEGVDFVEGQNLSFPIQKPSRR